MSDYDLISIGGGIAGSALGSVMAQAGARVLIVERETAFSDRVRGEWVAPWGVAELRQLGLDDAFTSIGAHDLPCQTTSLIGRAVRRDYPQTTDHGLPARSFFHPAAQEALIQRAEEAGAEVRRGSRVVAVHPGAEPRVSVTGRDRDLTISARLVVSAEGRSSLARSALRLPSVTHRSSHLLAGVLLDQMSVDDTSGFTLHDLATGRIAFLFPQGNGRARAYVGYPANDGERLQGRDGLARFIATSIACGVPPDVFAQCEASGPLATFSGDDTWVDHPYAGGVALIGDAAGISDPTWGQGLSLAFRDIRMLRDALLADDDWDAAGHAYAGAHDAYFQTIMRVEDWIHAMFLERSAEADARRERALPLIAEDPTRVPNQLASGPDTPADERARRRFFGQDQ